MRRTLTSSNKRIEAFHKKNIATKINYQRPQMASYQSDILDAKERFTATTASTKVGKTFSHYVWLFEEALKGRQGYNYWWVAPVRSQAKIAFTRLSESLAVTDAKGKRIEGLEKNLSELKLTINSVGSHLWFKSADNPDTLYGDDVYAAVFDEFTRAKDTAWHALYSTLTATKGRCKLIGNVKGRGWGHDLVVNAQAGRNDWRHFKVTALDAVREGILDADIVEQAKRDLPEDRFNELYLAEPPKDGDNPFGFDYIAQAITHIAGGEPLYFGIDLAKSVDYTVIFGFDKNGHMSFAKRFRNSWGNTLNIIEGIIEMYPKALFYIDSTGVGDPIVEQLHKKSDRVVGFQFNENSKQQIMEGLALALQKSQIKIFEGLNDGLPRGEEERKFLRNELENYEYFISTSGKVKYRVKSGHDDGVCALALAVKSMKEGNTQKNIGILPTYFLK